MAHVGTESAMSACWVTVGECVHLCTCVSGGASSPRSGYKSGELFCLVNASLGVGRMEGMEI